MVESSAKRFLKEKKRDKAEKYLEFASQNIQQIDAVLKQHRPEDCLLS